MYSVFTIYEDECCTVEFFPETYTYRVSFFENCHFKEEFRYKICNKDFAEKLVMEMHCEKS